MKLKPPRIVFKERMAGGISEFDNPEEIPAEFNIEAVSAFTPYSLVRGDLLFKIKGMLVTEFFDTQCHCGNNASSHKCDRCKNVSHPLEGWLIIDIVRRKLTYAFYFGEDFCFFFRGEKNVQVGGVRKLLKTMTYLPGIITPEEMCLNSLQAVFRFDLKHDLLPMLLSFRIRF